MTEFRTVTELGAAYRGGSLTPQDVVEAALEQAAQLEPKLNAFACLMAVEVRADAERRTEELRSGKDLGPLHGIPIAIKDLIDVQGVPTGYGSKVERPRIAAEDAVLVARLRAAGAVIFGKTNLLEYAYGVAHPDIGQTNNPHDPTRTAGGSSGGSAAAVAAGIVPLAIGTDTGGSIRIPAAYCGILGLKPSYGLVPLNGVFPLSWSLDHAGPLARNATDAALVLACLAAQPMPIVPRPIRGLRIGVLTRHVSTTAIGDEVSVRFWQAVDGLGLAGANITQIDLPELERANQILMTILHPEASVIHEHLIAANAAGYASGTRRQLEAGMHVIATDYIKSQRLQGKLRDAVQSTFATFDVLISPSVPFVAPVEDPETVDGEDSEILASGFANVTGHPSLSLPCRIGGGLPAGMQLTGALGSDAQLLSIAASFETCWTK